MRNLVYRFDDLSSFAAALREGDQELPLPPGERVDDNEWVLAIFEVAGPKSDRSGRAGHGRATAAAARGLDRGGGSMALGFERRDWERLVEFSEAKSEKLKTVPPVAPDDDEPDEAGLSIPIDVEPLPQPVEDKPKRKSTLPPRASERPKKKTSTPPAPARPAFTGVRADARVLLVDDDRDIRQVVGAMLEAVGLKVETTASAEDALERLRTKKRYDLVVLDWNLPGMTGIELCRVLRREPTFTTLPVLFLTAHASSKDVVEAFASGADDYVVKPFRAPELGARIFGLLRRVRAAQPTP